MSIKTAVNPGRFHSAGPMPVSKWSMNTTSRISTGLSLLAVGAALSLSAQTPVPNTFLVHNLVADQAGVADVTDPNLVNPWGNGFSAASPFWVGNQEVARQHFITDTA